MWIFETIANALYNRELKRKGIIKDDVIVATTIGWRRDPINQEDGQIEVENPRSGNVEYQTVIRRGKQTD